VRSLPATTIAPWVLLVAAEVVAVAIYFILTPTEVRDPRTLVYPFIWINLGLWAIATVRPSPVSQRAKIAGIGIAAGYFLVLAWLTGLVALYIAGHNHGHAHIHGLQVSWVTPGWGPRVAYVTDLFHVYFVPYRVVGYLGLAYLLYVAVTDAAASALSGVVGLASCLGCAFPVVGSTLATLGGSAAIIDAIRVNSPALSTLLFVVAMGLLWWRPGTNRKTSEDCAT
jgi:hypothetical protein